MPVERVFIEKGLKRAQLEEYLEKELEAAGYGGVDIRRTPMGTRITLYVERPGLVIGRKGRSIKQLTDVLARDYGVEKPQVEVAEIDVPELNASVMARRIAFALERGRYFRRVGHAALSQIMQAGARGVEINISGKVRGERHRCERFYEGYLKKAGEPASKFVREGYAVAKLKPGVLGIRVRIMPPDIRLPDEVRLVEEEKKVEVKPAEEAPVSEKVSGEKLVESAESPKPQEVEKIGDTQT